MINVWDCFVLAPASATKPGLGQPWGVRVLDSTGRVFIQYAYTSKQRPGHTSVLVWPKINELVGCWTYEILCPLPSEDSPGFGGLPPGGAPSARPARPEGPLFCHPPSNRMGEPLV